MDIKDIDDYKITKKVSNSFMENVDVSNIANDNLKIKF